MTVDKRATPLATDEQTQAILSLLRTASDSNNLKIGANEVTKILNKGKAQFVILAADCEPFEITAHLPLICEDKNVPFVYVPSKIALGKGCDIKRAVVACGIFYENDEEYSRNKKIIDPIVNSLNK
ncbi:13 kDa ribonucleoprotein-associated protein [Astathelohania contejeani]|uniref:H/ACA ribonucleoprotein complex subunit 2 n=1 Tax=Astathelohania contejeani TaxID=164912 RepID=A0ABQ7HXN9_9MICR|nr:13 kDa ribonucleoprotein-associated protein [Thelohania contejeani]